MSITTPKTIRTRFAPSPTGYPHIGSMWQALMQWLYVRHHQGVLVLRIEDTDRQRYVEDAETRMLEALTWYGLAFDEGPEVGGAFGPYRQSERLALYREHAEQLIAENKAYPCFCSPADLEVMRREQQLRGEPPRYDRRCLLLTRTEATARRTTEAHVVRMKFPTSGETRFVDAIRGEIIFQNALIDDQVLLKSDGWPTYHLAVVVDDHFMEINTVIRGEEWLSSTPKHLVLYELFGWEPPTFAHLPLILGPDRSKLSKRHGSTEALRFREEGYLPEALVNYLALLGWNPKTEQEFFTPEELISLFDFSGINKSGAIFDIQKLQWFNAHYIKKLSLEDLVERVKPYLLQANYLQEKGSELIDTRGAIVTPEYLARVVALFRERLKTLGELPDLAAYFFEMPEYEVNLLVWKNSTRDATLKTMALLVDAIELISATDFVEETIESHLKQFIEKEGLGTGDALWPLRVALSGRKESPGPFALATALGKVETLARLNEAQSKLSL